MILIEKTFSEGVKENLTLKENVVRWHITDKRRFTWLSSRFQEYDQLINAFVSDFHFPET